MNAYIEFMEKAQAEFLNSVKQTQDLNLKTVAAMTGLVAAMPTPEAKDVQSMSLPTATELVERTFAFTNEFLNTRKEYMLKLADLSNEATKTFTETAKRMADQAKSVEATMTSAVKNGTAATAQTVSSKN